MQINKEDQHLNTDDTPVSLAYVRNLEYLRTSPPVHSWARCFRVAKLTRVLGNGSIFSQATTDRTSSASLGQPKPGLSASTSAKDKYAWHVAVQLKRIRFDSDPQVFTLQRPARKVCGRSQRNSINLVRVNA